MIRILANIEYLLQPENANKTLKNKDISVNNNVRIIPKVKWFEND